MTPVGSELGSTLGDKLQLMTLAEGDNVALVQQSIYRHQCMCTCTLVFVCGQEMEDIISKLEKAQLQVKEYQDKYSQEVENTDIR